MMPSRSSIRATRPLLALFSVTLLAGCATFSDDGGFALVQSETSGKLDKQAHWLKDEAAKSVAKS